MKSERREINPPRASASRARSVHPNPGSTLWSGPRVAAENSDTIAFTLQDASGKEKIKVILDANTLTSRILQRVVEAVVRAIHEPERHEFTTEELWDEEDADFLGSLMKSTARPTEGV